MANMRWKWIWSRCAKWLPVECMIISAADFTVTQSIATGTCPTSKKYFDSAAHDCRDGEAFQKKRRRSATVACPQSRKVTIHSKQAAASASGRQNYRGMERLDDFSLRPGGANFG